MDTYYYETGASCPTYYDIETYRQVFYSEKGEMIPVDGVGSLRSPWGDGGVTYIKNQEAKKAVPKILKIGYYSETEDQFFEGEFQLDKKLIERLLQEKSINREQENQFKYNRIEVGIALGGMVVIWVKGKNNQKEVGKYNAEQVQRNWKNIFDNGTQKDELDYNLQHVFTAKVKNEVLTKTLPTDLWNLYRKKYNWNIKAELPQGGKIEEIHIKRMINGEAEVFSGEDTSKENRALPYNIELYWTLNGKKYHSRIVFGNQMNYYNIIYKASLAKKEEEAFPSDFRDQEVYLNFQQINEEMPAQLIFKLNENQAPVLILQQNDKKITFKNIIAKTFEQ